MSCRRWLLLVALAVCLALTSGCAALPTLVPDMARHRAPVALDDANGPLSIARSQAIIERLQARGASSTFFDLHLAIEESIVGSPLTTGNRVELLQDGPRTYTSMLEAIADAREHINMESYIFDDDEVGQHFADALIAKQQAGVQVNLIHDSVGTLGTATSFFTRLSEAGVQVVEFNPINPLTAKAGWTVNQRDHRKLLIVDGRIAFLGGINISSVYSGSSLRLGSQDDPASDLPWRDTHLRLEGPVVGELQKLFIDTWAKQKGPPLPIDQYVPAAEARGSEVVRAIGSSPDDPYSLIYVTLISALRSAQDEIWLTNAYFVPDPQLLSTLKDAVARGVDVRLILPSSTDSWLVFHAGRAYYDELLQAGVRLYERHEALLHAKTAVIDGVWSTVGSTNLDWRSFLHNQEVNAVVLGNDFGDKMRAAFRADLEKSREITLPDWQERPLNVRAKELFGRLWVYWL
ncbi:cardiolipin synthase [Pseudomonas sp. EA_35y_Pfl2_R111]|uniref:cardiolipin synthase n=1 Tax=Pseudomonas sp. EA_35y_Pfl2_R111 TaxID=3088689 RepID=UPI0030D7E8F3